MKEMPRTFLSALLLLFLAVGNLVPHTIALAVSAAANDSASNNPGSARPNFRDKGLILVKIGCLIIAFCGTFLGGISPYFYRWNDAFLVLGTQFAGGVFLGTALMHFLKDANSTFEDLTEKKYPFAFMLATAGYLLTLYGDCLIQWIFAKEVAAGHVDVEKGGRKPASSQERRDGRDNKASKANGVEGSSENIEKDLPNDMMKASQGDICSCCGENLDDCGCEEQVVDPVVVRSTVKATLIRTTSFGDSILLIVALCFHSVFEGIAIGIAETKTDAWKALWTISLHKIFAAIAMGIALLRMIPNRPLLSCAAYSFFFGISSPVGVAIGIIIDDTSEGSIADWTFAISMGLACGVFVYVSVNHLLGKGYVPPCQIAVDTPFHKLLAVVLGAALIAVVMIWDT